MSNPMPCRSRWSQPQEERPITWGERKTLQAVASLLKERPYPPTIRDVAARRHVTVNAARERLDALEVKGLIGRYPGRVRAIWLTQKGLDVLAEEMEAEIHWQKSTVGKPGSTEEACKRSV